ncbi:MAG: hypothetical protein KDC79_14440 [Cyclobacteriaceae bacterium]|nr:hypothetical protein [Cyclobacteriaceae bacterium]
MFLKIGEINNIIHNYEITLDYIIAVVGNSKESHLKIFDKSLKVQKDLQKYSAYDFINVDKYIIFTSNNADFSYAYQKSDERILKLPYILHIKGEKIDEQYLCYSQYEGKECYLLISLDSLEINKIFNIAIGFGNVNHIVGNMFISTKRHLGIFALFDLSNKLRWQANLGELGSYEDWRGKHKGEIHNLYYYRDTILVNSGPFIFCFSLNNGELLWSLRSNIEARFYSMVINKNKAYLLQNQNYTVIDIVNGIFIIEKKIDTFQYQGKEVFFDAHGEPVYNQGFIWSSLYSGGVSFVCAIEPSTGDVVWVQHLESGYKIESIKFNNNQMYILDTGGTLNILENIN